MLLSLDIPSVSRNYSDQTPFDLAADNSHQECANAIGNQRCLLR